MSSRWSVSNWNGQLIDTEGNLRPDIGIYSHNASPMLYCRDNILSFVHAKIDTVAATPDTLARVDIQFEDTYTEASPLGMGQNPHHYNYYLAHCPDGVTMTESYNRVVYPQLYEFTDLHVSGNNAWMKFEFVIQPGGDPEDILMSFEGAEDVELIEETGTLVVTSSIGTYVFNRPKAMKIDDEGDVTELGWQPDWELSVEGNAVRFINIGEYDEEEVLVLSLGEEPLELAAGGEDNLEWSTYLGGSLQDIVYDVVSAENGDLYVIGTTHSANFPFNVATSTSVAQPNFGGVEDGFVTKFDNQAAMLWTTYYGGATSGTEAIAPASDFALGGIDTGNENFFCFTGITWCSDFPTQPFGSYYYQENLGGDRDAFIVLLKPDGQRAWATYFGGNTKDMAYDIKRNTDGDFYICGSVAGAQVLPYDPIVPVEMSDNYCGTPTNNGFPLCSGGISAFFDDTYNGPVFENGFDSFIARFNADGLQWSTLFGGNSSESAWDLAIDPSDNSVVITGPTRSTTVGDNDQTAPCDAADNNGFPLCYSASEYLQATSPVSPGKESAYVAQFNEDNELVWSTFFGGDDSNFGNGLAFNSTGDLYLVGAADVDSESNLPDPFCAPPTNGGFPMCDPGNGAYYKDNSNDARYDVFISRFSPSRQLLWSTYYGGSGAEMPMGFLNENGTANVVIDEEDRVYILFSSEKLSGTPSDVDINPVAGFYNQSTHEGNGFDAFIASFNSDNQPLWATYFGGGGEGIFASDYGLSMSLQSDWLYIAGTTISNLFPQRCPTGYPNPYCQPEISSTTSYDGFVSRFDISEMPTDVLETEGLDNSTFTIYPNPTMDNITLGFVGHDNQVIIISIYDAMGRVVNEMEVTPSSVKFIHQMSFAQYPSGLYMVQARIGDDLWVKKVLKQH